MTTQNSNLAVHPNNPAVDDDEISLVDLVAVVVRFRRLIVGGTVLVAVFAVTVLYALPGLGMVAAQGPEYTAEKRLIVSAIPADLQRYVSVDPGVVLRTILLDPQLVGEVYASFEEDPPAARSREGYHSFVRREIIGKRLTIAWDAGLRVLTIAMTMQKSGDAFAFVDALIDRGGVDLALEMRRQLTAAEGPLTRSLEIARSTFEDAVTRAAAQYINSGRTVDPQTIPSLVRSGGDAAFGTLAQLELTVERLRTFNHDPASLYVVLGAPIAFEVAATGRRSTSAIVAVVTAFFLFVFLAFVLQYIHNVRRDPQEMAKIRAAWQGDSPPIP